MRVIEIASRQYKIDPKDVKLDVCGAVPSVFGKYEVELAAGKLVKYFQYRRNGWCSFTFVELKHFYDDNHWPSGEMLFGLMGAWVDDMCIQDSLSFVVHTGDSWCVTTEFVDRCARAK